MASSGRKLHPSTTSRIQELRKTLSLRKIARQLDISVPTVRKYSKTQEQSKQEETKS